MPLPPFILCPERPGESICTKCFLTVRMAGGNDTIEKAQTAHVCYADDLAEVMRQSKEG